MTIDQKSPTVRITLDEVEETERHALPAPQGTLAGRSLSPRNYGSVSSADAGFAGGRTGRLVLQTWFYLGCAGMAGSLLAWAMAEQGFIDGDGVLWGNVWMLPLIVMLTCVGFAIAESVIARSREKVLRRAALSLVLGVAFGFALDWLANAAYQVGLDLCKVVGGLTIHNPAVWITRGIAWAIFGAGGGVVYGIVDRSLRKTAYGALGGAIGAFLGGAIFDPISLATSGGAPSRAIGFGLLGLSTGVAMGLVENAFKERWLYVTGGPLTGKQFILYKPYTSIGSHQSCDIYLFKDPQVESVHASLQVRNAELCLEAAGEVTVSGQRLRGPQILENGDILQIGRYTFRYQEKLR